MTLPTGHEKQARTPRYIPERPREAKRSGLMWPVLEMTDSRRWCVECGVHVADDRPPERGLLCPGCIDERQRTTGAQRVARPLSRTLMASSG
jgi:hypothetical protein